TILKPVQLLSKLDRRFELLRSNRRDLPARQQTLAATIEWSFDLLAPHERHALLQLTAFPQGFFLEAAEAVVELTELPDAPLTMDIVQSLREKCLLRAHVTAYGVRFSMYQSIREYGERQHAACSSPEDRQALGRRVG